MTESSPSKSILLIQNTGKRLDALRPIFETLQKGGYGKLTSAYFAIESKYKFTKVENQDQRTFNMLQEASQRGGHNTTCYCFNI